eukprot:5317712-Pleurochrysis_carterae.AAC.2
MINLVSEVVFRQFAANELKRLPRSAQVRLGLLISWHISVPATVFGAISSTPDARQATSENKRPSSARGADRRVVRHRARPWCHVRVVQCAVKIREHARARLHVQPRRHRRAIVRGPPIPVERVGTDGQRLQRREALERRAARKHLRPEPGEAVRGVEREHRRAALEHARRRRKGHGRCRLLQNHVL